MRLANGRHPALFTQESDFSLSRGGSQVVFSKVLAGELSAGDSTSLKRCPWILVLVVAFVSILLACGRYRT
jgi:hypothetical protein